MTDQDINGPEVKIRKCSGINLKSFKVDEIINSLNREKVLIVKGKFSENEDDSILIFEKSCFTDNVADLQNALLNDDFQLSNVVSNDIYSTDRITGMASLNSIKLTSIVPATEKHFQKYCKSHFHYLQETPEIYTKITKPHVEISNFSLDWIDNLLQNKAETDRVLIPSSETKNNFVLVLDYKWDGKILENIHCLAVVCDYSLQSLRDLTENHLPLLREILEKTQTFVENHYKIPRSQLRFYFHYPPTFYHLHVHVNHIQNDSAGALVDRAYLLSTVIQNISLKGDYYQKASLEVSVNENFPIYQKYKSNNCL